MPLYNRERDFTEATISTLRENLKGETEPYTEFRQWMNEHADAFKDTSFSSDLLSVDRYMTDRREFNETALHELNRMERAVHEADEHFAGQCKETAEELRGFAKQIDDLSQSVVASDFISTFSALQLSGTDGFALVNYAGEVQQSIQYVILDPAFREFINALLVIAGLAPLVDGPLPIGDVVAILILLVALGLITVAALTSLLQWLYGMTTTTTVAVTLPTLTAEMITQAVNDLDTASKKVKILLKKHNWHKLEDDPDGPDGWEEIKKIIHTVLAHGASEVYGYQRGADGYVYKSVMEIKGEIVEVVWAYIDGILRISDAWVK